MGSTGSKRRRSYHGRKPKGTKVTFAIQFGFEETYEIEVVLELTFLKQGISIMLGFPLTSESSTFDIYPALLLIQPSENETLPPLVVRV